MEDAFPHLSLELAGGPPLPPLMLSDSELLLPLDFTADKAAAEDEDEEDGAAQAMLVLLLLMLLVVLLEDDAPLMSLMGVALLLLPQIVPGWS